jgi:putative ABC transport system substrate-binding protein
MPFDQLKRREVITLLGGAAVAWPHAARAQQADRVRRIGVLLDGDEKDPAIQAAVTALRAGLQALKWTEGQNYRFEYRWPGSAPDGVQATVADMVRAAPDVIVVRGMRTALLLRKETTTIPIVFANLADPVGAGLIPSLARTGGNITGFTAYEYATSSKWLEVLKEIAPHVKRAALIFAPTEANPTGENFYRALVPVAPRFSVELTPIRVRNAADTQSGIDAFAAKPDGGLIAAAEPGAINNRAAIIAAAARHRMPAVYPFRFFVADGGLASYGIDLNDQFRRAAAYVDRILKGANPADLPVQAPDKFLLIINLKTAKAQGIEIPPLMLTRADEVIE